MCYSRQLKCNCSVFENVLLVVYIVEVISLLLAPASPNSHPSLISEGSLFIMTLSLMFSQVKAFFFSKLISLFIKYDQWIL